MPVTLRFYAGFNWEASEVGFMAQVATFDIDEVRRVASLDKKGEFFVVVIGDTAEEKKFKVKTKHFDRLP